MGLTEDTNKKRLRRGRWMAVILALLAFASSFDWTGRPLGFGPNAALTLTLGLLISGLIYLTFGTQLAQRQRALAARREPGWNVYLGTALVLAIIWLAAFALTRNYGVLIPLVLSIGMLAFSALYRLAIRARAR
jgi:ABC-type xylose transport system permease subunit